jgi:hypothetical protein
MGAYARNMYSHHTFYNKVLYSCIKLVLSPSYQNSQLTHKQKGTWPIISTGLRWMLLTSVSQHFFTFLIFLFRTTAFNLPSFSLTTNALSFLSDYLVLHLFIPTFLKSDSTPSIQLTLRLLFFLPPFYLSSSHFFIVLSPSILTCPSYSNETVQKSLYWPRWALRLPGGWGFQI